MRSGRSRASTGRRRARPSDRCSGDRDETVRRAAIYSAGLWRDRAAVPQLLTAVNSGQPASQRVAAEALGRIGDARAVPELDRGLGIGDRPRPRTLADLRAHRDRRCRGDRERRTDRQPLRVRGARPSSHSIRWTAASSNPTR